MNKSTSYNNMFATYYYIERKNYMEIKNWNIIQGEGQVTQSNNLINKFNSNKKDKNKGYCLFRSDKYFKEGTVQFQVKFSDSNSSAALVLHTHENHELIIGYSRVLEGFTINVDDHTLSKAGNLDNFNLNNIIDFNIEIKGSIVSLRINDIEMCKASIEIAENQLEIVLNSDVETEVSNIKIQTTSPSAFIVMQFSDEYNQLYNEVIIPICNDLGIDCIRADEIFFSSPIIQDIIENIMNSSLIIAEITPDNPNVFYEIGYAHAINKPTILLCDRKRDNLPFDLSGFRTIFYDNTIVGKRKIEENLKLYLKHIFRKIT